MNIVTILVFLTIYDTYVFYFAYKAFNADLASVKFLESYIQ